MQTGTANQRKYVPIHTLHSSLSATVIQNFPAFHGPTGCDSTSQFAGNEKILTWKRSQKHSELLSGLGNGQIRDVTIKDCEMFVLNIYSPESSETSVNAVRVAMFGKIFRDDSTHS